VSNHKYIIGDKYKKDPGSALPTIILGCIVALVFLYAVTLYTSSAAQVVHSSEQPVASKSPFLEAPAAGLPVRLDIPKINVSASILAMGLTPAGDMDVPTSIATLGWYQYGSRPGDKGTAVIGGHVGVSGPGVFADLGQLQKGDSLSVVDDKGQTSFFMVRETRKYSPTEHPSEVFTSKDGSHLNLITCAGTWDAVNQRYSERLVIFSDKVY
jgi:sortase A